jgi:MoaA/NifB/PqqE/SkfB family radical SAM enzyme
MKYLTIQGERKKIPAYPHHKNFIYRTYRFFAVKSLFSFLTIDGLLMTPKRFLRNKKYGCAIPRLLLIDPTSGCNLKCKGCWASDYDKGSNLSYQKLDELLGEASRLGVLYIIMSGGEPLLRKSDILKLCRKYSNLTFGLFTNGTLIDEPFADEMARLGNLNVFISIEGFREETDFRRGEGVYDRVIAAMDLMKARDIGFGFSSCYHSKNYRTIASDEFLDFMQEKGAWFGWLFNYLPIGSDADVSLCCQAEERAYVMQKVDAYSAEHQYTLIDFANSGHKAIGCVAAGNDFAHINAHGDLEPCAFCHYSDVNIHDVSLQEALGSPFFKKFRAAKPFSENFLKPCPMLDVPEAIVRLTADTHVRSTHLAHPETAGELASKTRPLAGKWGPVADGIFSSKPEGEKVRFGRLNKLLQAANDLKKT